MAVEGARMRRMCLSHWCDGLWENGAPVPVQSKWALSLLSTFLRIVVMACAPLG